MKRIGSSASALVIAISLPSSAFTKECPGILRLGVQQRELYQILNGSVRRASEGVDRSQSARLAYIVPSHQFTSGAIIVKLQYSGTRFESKIGLTRDRYQSPCDQTVTYKKFDAQRDPTQYRSYHKHFAVDQASESENFDNFHADVGVRPIPRSGGLGYARGWQNDCLRTRSQSVRAQALFEEDRYPATWGEQFTWWGTSVLAPNAALAAPVYRQFQKLSTSIIPYTKPASQSLCVEIPLTIPPDTTNVVVSIVDADDAHNAFYQGDYRGPQVSRTIPITPTTSNR